MTFPRNNQQMRIYKKDKEVLNPNTLNGWTDSEKCKNQKKTPIKKTQSL